MNDAWRVQCKEPDCGYTFITRTLAPQCGAYGRRSKGFHYLEKIEKPKRRRKKRHTKWG